jgi:hypothetical protein
MQIGRSDFRTMANREAPLGGHHQSLGEFHVLLEPGVLRIQAHLQDLVPGEVLFFTHGVSGQDAYLAAQHARQKGDYRQDGTCPANDIVTERLALPQQAKVIIHESFRSNHVRRQVFGRKPGLAGRKLTQRKPANKGEAHQGPFHIFPVPERGVLFDFCWIISEQCS